MESHVDLKMWVSDKLMSLVGYYQPTVVQFLIGLSKKASSPAEIAANLAEFGISSSSGELRDFADEIFSRVPRSITGPNLYQQREREAAILAGKQNKYELLDAEDDDRPSTIEPRSKGSNRKRFRVRKVEDEDDELFEDRKVRQRGSSDDDESVRLRDQREKDELERNMKARDLARTRKISRKEEKEAIRRSNEDSAYLRKVSRYEYLKKRQDKKIEELRDEIIDEGNLFDGVKLTEQECRELNRKKEVYELVRREKAEDVVDTIGYQMPDAYDLEGNVNQERRFAVARERFKDRDSKSRLSEQSAWEEHQMDKAKLEFGSKDGKRGGVGDYEFVFDDEIKFIKTCVMEGDKIEDVSVKETKAKAKEALGKLQEDRTTLPIYAYREKFLQAIHDHQILIIVGETGSGKTTQIPQYLHESGFTKRGMIGCTQPRRVAAMSVAGRVSREMGVKLGREVGYSIRFEDCTSEKTIIKYMTDGMLLREFLSDPMLDQYSVIMVDEAHERTISTDILFGLVKDLARIRPDLKLLISSATLDAVKFSDYFDSAPIFSIPGRPYPVEIYYTQAPEADYLDAATGSVLQIHLTQPLGDILVFLTGQEEIETAEEILKNRIRGFGSKIGELVICPIYANLPTDLQGKIFEATPQGARKVVLATNIAETSLTIDGIKYVIDPGYSKIKSYDPRAGMESLVVAPISKASANQRAGRSGRTGPGKCFRLYTNFSFKEELEDNTAPEIQRTNLGNVVLTLKMLGIKDIMHFDFLDPPPSESMLKAFELLYSLGALNKLGELTKMGRRMAEFPVDPMLSKMIVVSDTYKCSEEITTIAAMLSIGNSIFYSPKDKRVHAETARMRFHEGSDGDHIALLKVYNEWKACEYGTQWCYENFVQVRSMKRARDIRDQLEGLLERVEIEKTSSLNDMEVIKKCITAGFFPHCAKLEKSGAYRTIKNPQTVYMHPGSGLAQVHPPPRWVVYHELVLTTKKYLRQVTEIKPEWLVEIAPHYYQLKDVEDSSKKKMPRGIGLAA